MYVSFEKIELGFQLGFQLGTHLHIHSHPHKDKIKGKNGDFEAIDPPLFPNPPPLNRV